MPVAISLWLAGVRLRSHHTHSHTHTAAAPGLCLRVCSCVYLASLVSPSFGVSLPFGNARTTKTAPCAQLSHVFHSRLAAIFIAHSFCAAVVGLCLLLSLVSIFSVFISFCVLRATLFFLIHSRLLFSSHFLPCYISNHCFLSKLSIPLERLHRSHLTHR